MKKNREVLAYLVFGVLTTIVSVVSFQLACKVLNYLAANVLSWIIAVTFAFVTNKKYVFKSKTPGWGSFLGQMAGFYAARLFSLGVEELGLFLMIDILAVSRLISKLVLQVVVVVLNYVLSKMFVFKKK